MNATKPPLKGGSDTRRDQHSTRALVVRDETADRLAQCEAVIERGLATFVEVGYALLVIRDERLYRETHATFEDYCRERWGWSRSRAYRLIDAADIVGMLPMGDIPINERQARELVPLRDDPEALRAAWEAASADGPPTAASIRAVVRELPHVSYNSGESEWYTPPQIIEAARRVLGEIDLDPASCAAANTVVGARTWYGPDHPDPALRDGRSLPWAGRVFLNPPYAAPLIGRFVERVIEGHESGAVTEAVTLTNNATDTAWCQRLLRSASAICLVAGRVRFLDPAGRPGAPLQGQLIAYLGHNVASFVREFRSFGRVLSDDPSAARARLLRLERDKLAAERRNRHELAALPPSCDLRLGDFRTVLADIAPVDVILTDPPYPAEFLPLWSDLGRFAAAKLRPGGLLVAMSGNLHEDEAKARLAEHLPYRCTIAYLTPGPAAVVHALNVMSGWKPVLVFGGTERRLYNVVRSDGAEKGLHVWGQSESGTATLLRLVADPGEVVCDPCAGSGTTAVVALRHGCSFVGAEIDPRHYETAVVRLGS